MKKLIVIILVYVVGLLLTYGRNYHEFLEQQNARWPILRNERDAVVEAMASAIAWPVYWPFRLSREAFAKNNVEVDK